jgi:hypothetical protein
VGVLVTAYWTIWLLLIAIGFVIGEAYALKHDRQTFSRYVWNISKAFPPLPFFVGVGVGFLAAHFWWGGIVTFEP